MCSSCNASFTPFLYGKRGKKVRFKLQYLLHEPVGEAPPLVEAPLLVNGQGVVFYGEVMLQPRLVPQQVLNKGFI